MARRFDKNGNKKAMGYEMRLDTIEGGSVFLIFDLEGNLMTASTKMNYGGHWTDETPDRETVMQTCWGKVRITPDFYKPRAIRKSARKMLEGGAQASTVSFTLQTTWGEKYAEIIDGAINEWKDGCAQKLRECQTQWDKLQLIKEWENNGWDVFTYEK